MTISKLSIEQLDWITEVTADRNIVFMSIHGSWLYGLNHEGSDFDIKAIYAPSKEDLLLGKALKTYNKKCDELDIEMEIKSLSSFLNSAASADTNCIDLLHTPDALVLKTSMLWEDIKRERKCIYSKNMKGMIGYIKTHSHKYTNKINRMEEMKDLLKEISFIDDNTKIQDTTIPEQVDRLKYKYIKNVSVVSDHEQKYIEVVGKKYIVTWETKLLKDALKYEINRYGKRTADGSQKGLDGKSLSHAMRVLCELKEIILTKGLVFPLKDKEHLLNVKLGKVSYEEVMADIDSRYEECMELISKCDLPEQSDISPILNNIKRFFFFDEG